MIFFTEYKFPDSNETVAIGWIVLVEAKHGFSGDMRGILGEKEAVLAQDMLRFALKMWSVQKVIWGVENCSYKFSSNFWHVS